MSDDQKDFVELCELIGTVCIPFIFFHANVTIATSLPIDELYQQVLIIWLMYFSLKLGPHIGGILGIIILMFENKKE
jgi:hypothetical protein